MFYPANLEVNVQLQKTGFVHTNLAQQSVSVRHRANCIQWSNSHTGFVYTSNKIT